MKALQDAIRTMLWWEIGVDKFESELVVLKDIDYEMGKITFAYEDTEYVLELRRLDLDKDQDNAVKSAQVRES